MNKLALYCIVLYCIVLLCSRPLRSLYARLSLIRLPSPHLPPPSLSLSRTRAHSTLDSLSPVVLPPPPLSLSLSFTYTRSLGMKQLAKVCQRGVATDGTAPVWVDGPLRLVQAASHNIALIRGSWRVERERACQNDAMCFETVRYKQLIQKHEDLYLQSVSRPECLTSVSQCSAKSCRFMSTDFEDSIALSLSWDFRRDLIERDDGFTSPHSHRHEPWCTVASFVWEPVRQRVYQRKPGTV